MPTAPLYYTPLVLAAVQSTSLGVTAEGKPGPTIADAADKQVNFALPRGEDGTRSIAPGTTAALEFVKTPMRDGIAATMNGVMALVDSRKGSQLAQVNLAVSEDGYIANRTLTTLGNHPNMLDTASPDEASKIAANLASEISKDPDHTTANYAGGTLDIGPGVSALIVKSWEKKPVTPIEAAQVGVHVGREIEKSVTPTAPDTTSSLQWIEDATATTLSLWPGAVANTARTLGFETDWAQVDQIAAGWRADVLQDSSAKGRAVVSLQGLLALAGVEMNNAKAADRVAALLQGVPLNQVPASLATGIAEQFKLPADKVDWLAGRIIEVGGHPGNVGGLKAELDQLQAPPVAPPAPPAQ